MLFLCAYHRLILETTLVVLVVRDQQIEALGWQLDLIRICLKIRSVRFSSGHFNPEMLGWLYWKLVVNRLSSQSSIRLPLFLRTFRDTGIWSLSFNRYILSNRWSVLNDWNSLILHL